MLPWGLIHGEQIQNHCPDAADVRIGEHDGLRNYPGHVRCRAMDAHDRGSIGRGGVPINGAGPGFSSIAPGSLGTPFRYNYF